MTPVILLRRLGGRVNLPIQLFSTAGARDSAPSSRRELDAQYHLRNAVPEWEHFFEALSQTKVDAVAAANIFNYKEQSVFFAKKHLFERGAKVRKPELFTIN
mgnify:CR=1 FL=1